MESAEIKSLGQQMDRSQEEAEMRIAVKEAGELQTLS